MFFPKAQNLNYGSYEKSKGVSEKRLCRHEVMCTHKPCNILAFPVEGLYHGRLFQLIFNFHMALRMHCVWFVSSILPNNPRSAGTPLAQAPTHAYEVNYGAPSFSTTLPSPFASNMSKFAINRNVVQICFHDSFNFVYSRYIC